MPPLKFLRTIETVYLRPHSEAFMRLLESVPSRSPLHALAVLAVVGAFASTLTGCPDKASPDPAGGKPAATTTAAAAPHPGTAGSAAAPAKSGGW